MNYRIGQRIRLNQLKITKNSQTFLKSSAPQLSPLLQHSQTNVMEMLVKTISKLNQKIQSLGATKPGTQPSQFKTLQEAQQDTNQTKNNHYGKESYSHSRNYQFQSSTHPKEQIIKIQFPNKIKNFDLCQVERFLVHVTDIVLSTGFNYYLNDILTKNQAKAFCSKGIILNTKQIFQSSQNWQDPLQKVQIINQILKNIVLANLKRYPQRALVGTSQRVKDVIPTTNLLQSDQYDFLYLNKICITSKEQQNYFSQMMKTINKMIQTPPQLIHTNSQSTLFDVFKQVLTMMVVFSTQECYNSQLKKNEEIDHITALKQKKTVRYSYHVKYILQNLLAEKLKKQIQQVEHTVDKIISETFDFNYKQTKNASQQEQILTSRSLKNNLKKQVRDANENEIHSFCNINQIKQSYENYLDQQKIKSKLKHLFVNTKLSSKVRKYSKQQIENGRFQVRDSTILRILSKWTQQLQEKFVNPNQKIYKRTQKFKNNHFQFTDIEQLQAQQNHIYFELVDRFQISKNNYIDPYVNWLQKQNFKHQRVFGQQICAGKYVKDQTTNVGVFSSKIQKMTGSYTINYLNCLINQLVILPLQLVQDRIFRQSARDGKDIYSKQKKQKVKNINLITLKIGDLMRGKYSCSQNEFIRLINIMQVFSKQNPGILKIIRVKNRLQAKDNDILINVLFMKKVQCEFQLSISNDLNNQASKQKKSNQFNHYLYQISRNSLGPISELAGILIQQDPLISQYFSKDIQKLQTIITFKNQINFDNYSKNYPILAADTNLQKRVKQLLTLLPYICQNCRNISNDYNSINRYKKQKVCLNCFIQKLKHTQEESNLQIGYEMMKSIWLLIHEQDSQKLDHVFSIQEYVKFVRFFDHSNPLTYSKSHTSQKFNDRIPKFGYFVDVNQKKPEFRIFIKEVFNQKIFLFKINENQRKNKLIQKSFCKQSQNILNHKKTDIIGVYQFKNSNKQKSWSQAIPKNYLIWNDETFMGFKKEIVNEFNKILLRRDQIQFIQKFIKNSQMQGNQIKDIQRTNYQSILENQINEHFIQNVVKERRSQININRFAKLSDKILTNVFLIYKKQALLIKQFRANQAIKAQQTQNDKNWIKQLKNLEILHLQSNQIHQFQFLETLKHLTHINFQDNLIQNLKGILKLDKIQHINLNTNSLKQFISTSSMKSLTHLYLAGNKLQSVDLSYAINLKILDLSKNYLKILSSLQKIENLQDLDISINKLQDGSFLNNNSSLVNLKINGNILKNICFVKKLKNLKLMNLRQNMIQSIEQVSNLDSLSYLYAQNNQIHQIQCLSNMPNLAFVSVCSNKIEKIKQLINIPKLQTILLEYNQIQSIGTLKNMPSLKYLNLKKMKIKSIQQLSLLGLEQLDLSINSLQDIQFLKELPTIKELSLQQNKIVSVQPLRSLKSLTKLNVSFNKVQDIECLCELSDLNELQLNNNKITKVPDLIYKLNKMTDLNLSYNLIPYAHSLKSCFPLKNLYLDGCSIIDVSFMISLSRLTTLSLSFNNIRDLNGLRHLNYLTVLRLKNNHIQNVEPISKLSSLNHLQIQFNNLKDIECLLSLPRSMRFYFNSNQITTNKQQAFKGKCRHKGIVAMF